MLGFQPVLNLIAGQGDRRWAVGPALDRLCSQGKGPYMGIYHHTTRRR